MLRRLLALSCVPLVLMRGEGAPRSRRTPRVSAGS